MVWRPPTIKILLPFYNCNFATGLNHNANIYVFWCLRQLLWKGCLTPMIHSLRTTAVIFVLVTTPILPLPSGFRLCPTTSCWHYWSSTYAKNLSKVEAETNGWAGGSHCSWGLSKPEAKWWNRAEQDAWGAFQKSFSVMLHPYVSTLPTFPRSSQGPAGFRKQVLGHIKFTTHVGLTSS